MDEINSDYVILSLTENCKLLQWDIKSGALYSEKIVENPNEKSLCTDVISAQYCSNGQKIVIHKYCYYETTRLFLHKHCLMH